MWLWGGSPLGPALANIFMSNFESEWLKDCPYGLKPVFCRWFVDEIYIYIYIYIKKANFIVCEYVTTVNIKKYFSIQIYFGTVFLRQCMCVCQCMCVVCVCIYIYMYCFRLSIMQKRLKSIYLPNIPTLIFP